MPAAAAAAEGQEQQPRQGGRFRASVIAAIVGSLEVVAALAIGLSLNGHQRHGAASTAATAEVTPMTVPPLVIDSAASDATTITTATTPSTTTTTSADHVNSGLFFDTANKDAAVAPTSALNTALTTGVPPPLFGGLETIF
jgi:hypothetical protein